MKALLELFCGRMSVSKAFAKRGWKCVGVDLVKPPMVPEGCEFIQGDVLDIELHGILGRYDFIWASSPCQEFSVHGMKHFFPNPKYPENGIKLFNHTRQLCETSGVPYVMENVRAAQQFVGNAVHHCGPFYLWGNAVPPLLNQGIQKGYSMNREATLLRSRRKGNPFNPHEVAKRMGSIPPELANCVAEYAGRLLEQRCSTPTESNPSPSTTSAD